MTDTEDKGGGFGKTSQRGQQGQKQPGSEKADTTVMKYGADYRLVFRLRQNARERLWKNRGVLTMYEAF